MIPFIGNSWSYPIFFNIQPAIKWSKLKIETLEQGVKYVQSQLWTYFILCFSVSIVNFEQVNAGWADEVARDWSTKLCSKNLPKLHRKFYTCFIQIWILQNFSE